MNVKCEYCDSYFDDQLEACPNCGGTNEHIRRVSNDIPKTIDELKAYCAANKVPLQQMHFHIGEDYKGAKAFGIYRNGEDVIVYKNKADGSRAVRYQGSDEAYAVNEIYQKLRSEYANHKAANTNRASMQPANRSGGNNRNRSKKSSSGLTGNEILGLAIFLFVIFGLIIALIFADKDGYYKYQNKQYYLQGSDWYEYDTYLDKWVPSYKPADDISDYYESSSYDDDYEISSFEDSSYYHESTYSSDSSSSWDDDDDWDSWDSGSDWDWDSGSDWDSDW